MELTPTEKRLKRYADVASRAFGTLVVFYAVGGGAAFLSLILLQIVPGAPDWLAAVVLVSFLVAGIAPILLPVVIRSYRRTVSGPDAAKHPYHHFRRIDGIGRGILFVVALQLSAYLGLSLARALGVGGTPVSPPLIAAPPLAIFLGLSYWYYRKLY